MSSPIQFTIIAIPKIAKTKFICFPNTEARKAKKKIDNLCKNHISFNIYTANYFLYQHYEQGVITETLKREATL